MSYPSSCTVGPVYLCEGDPALNVRSIVWVPLEASVLVRQADGRSAEEPGVERERAWPDDGKHERVDRMGNEGTVQIRAAGGEGHNRKYHGDGSGGTCAKPGSYGERQEIEGEGLPVVLGEPAGWVGGQEDRHRKPQKKQSGSWSASGEQQETVSAHTGTLFGASMFANIERVSLR